MGPRFNRLWLAAGVSNIGDGVMGAAFPLLVASITRDPVLVAGATVANRSPWFLFALVSGALVDRMDRRKVMVVTDGIRFAIVGLLGVFLIAGDVGLPLVYLVAFALGTAETFFDTSSEAILPDTVGTDALPAANGRLQATEWVGNAFLGPPLGALLFGVGVGLPFVIDAGTYLFAAIVVAGIGGVYRAERRVPQGLKADITEGLRWLWSHTVLRTLAIMAGITNLVGFAVLAVFVLFAQDIVGLSDLGYGLILAALGVGGLAGGLLAGPVAAALGQGRTLSTSVALLAAGGLAMVWITHPVAVAVVMAIVGFGITLWNVVAVSLRQRLTPNAMRGRVASVARLLAWGTQPIGAVLGGVIADVFGLRAPFLVGAAVWVAMLLVTLPIVSNRRIAALEASVSGD